MSIIGINFEHFGTITAAWKASMVAAALVFCYGFAGRIASGAHFLFGDTILIMAFVLTFAPFAIGDTGVLATTVRLQRLCRRGHLAQLVRKGVVLEYAFVMGHAAMLILLAWLCLHDALLFLACAVLLAGCNITGLAAKLMHFTRIDGRLQNKKYRPLKVLIQGCINSMLKWIIVNGLFLVALAVTFIVSETLTSPSLELFSRIAPFIVIGRSLADLILSNQFYGEVLIGKYALEESKNKSRGSTD